MENEMLILEYVYVFAELVLLTPSELHSQIFLRVDFKLSCLVNYLSQLLKNSFFFFPRDELRRVMAVFSSIDGDFLILGPCLHPSCQRWRLYHFRPEGSLKLNEFLPANAQVVTCRLKLMSE